MSASISTPASEVKRPPSKAMCTALPATGDEKAARSCRFMTRSTEARGRLHLRGRARPIGGIGVDVGTWVRRLGLGQYEEPFRAHDVDADVLPELTADDLSGLGVASIGHRRKLLAAIAV